MHYFSIQLLTFISFSIILLLSHISEANSLAEPTPRLNNSRGSLSDKKKSKKNLKTFKSLVSHTNTATLQTNNLAPQTSDSTPQTSDSAQHTSDLAQQTSDLAQQTSDLAQQTSDLAQQISDLAQQTSDSAPPEDPEVIQWLDAITWSSDECKHAVRERYATTEFSELNCGSVYLFNSYVADYFNCAEDEKCQMLKHFCKKSPEAEHLLIQHEIKNCSGKPQS